MDSTTFLKLRANLRQHARLRQAVHDAAGFPLVGPLIRHFASSALRQSGGEQWLQTSVGWMLLDPLWDGKYFFESDGEADTTEALRSRITPGMHVWDIGSHAGFYTMMMAGLVGSSGRVLAVEADPDNARRCREALVRNGIAGFCSVLSCAVCHETGEVRFRRSAAGRMSGKLAELARSGFGNTEEILDIPASTIDRIAQEHGLPDFVKIDIEGAEAQALRGASAVLARGRTAFLIEVHEPELLPEVSALGKEHGYAVTRLVPEQEAFPLHVVLQP